MPALEVTCILSFQAGAQRDGQYSLLLDSNKFSELPVCIEETEVPKVGHSIIGEHFGANT